MLRPNTFKRALEKGDNGLLGIWASACSPQVTEMLSFSPALQWLVVDMEHAPNTLPSVLAQLQCAQPNPVDVIVRVPVASDPVVVKHVLDLGARSIMFPAVESATEAAAAVASTRYPPSGVRGVMTTARMSAYAIDAASLRSYYESADRETARIIQVESAGAVERIPEIAAVDGVVRDAKAAAHPGPV